jgi:stress response protein YsnF
VAGERRILVELAYETVRIEERDLPDRPATGAELFQEGIIVVPLRGEEAVVTGEVVIAKGQVTARRYVTNTVRVEQAEVTGHEPRRRTTH